MEKIPLKFPLVLWDETEEFKKEMEEAEQKREELNEKLRKNGHDIHLFQATLGQHGIPEYWINSTRPLWWGKTVDQCIESAIKYGDTGYWYAEEVEQFIDGKLPYGKGPIFEHAMHVLNFKRSKRDGTKWIKREWNDYVGAFGKRKHPKLPEIELQQSDITRILESTAPARKADREPTKTLEILATGRNMIYTRLDFDIGSHHTVEMQNTWLREFGNGRIISFLQKGFTMKAYNFASNSYGSGVYIRATGEKDNITERIWPTRILYKDLDTLARDLSNAASPDSAF